jgi:hypothetical protein
MEEDKMNRGCCTREKVKEYIQGFGGKSRRKEVTWKT